MQTKDHKALALCLLNATGDMQLRRHRRAFLLGCVEPDYNLLTYVRGSLRHQTLRGHNAENVRRHIFKCLHELQENGLHSVFSYFTLGTLIHYIADIFTFPHNSDFTGNLREHRKYEHEMHSMFTSLSLCTDENSRPESSDSIWPFLVNIHRRYCSAPRSMETDCKYILQACSEVFCKILFGSGASPAFSSLAGEAL